MYAIATRTMQSDVIIHKLAWIQGTVHDESVAITPS